MHFFYTLNILIFNVDKASEHLMNSDIYINSRVIRISHYWIFNSTFDFTEIYILMS